MQFKLRSKLLKISGFIYPTSKGLNDLFLNILWLKPLTHGIDNNNWGIKNILLKLKLYLYQAPPFPYLSKVLSLWRNFKGISNLKKNGMSDSQILKPLSTLYNDKNILVFPFWNLFNSDNFIYFVHQKSASYFCTVNPRYRASHTILVYLQSLTLKYAHNTLKI